MAPSNAICSACVTPRDTTTAIQTASLTFGFRPSSRFDRPPAVAELAHAVDVDRDPEPRAIRHGDHVVPVPGAGVPDIFGQHQRTAHLDRFHVAHGDGHVQTGGGGDRALDHRPDL